MLLVKTKLKPSKIAGIGLFADQNIKKGEIIWEFTEGLDLLISRDRFKTLPEATKRQILNYGYYYDRTQNYVMCLDDARFFNHSAKPNTISTTDEKGETWALKDIKKGEELTSDYNEFDSEINSKLSKVIDR